ncbi:MAG: amidohydrolase family protein [Acidimicrobiales bacterium]
MIPFSLARAESVFARMAGDFKLPRPLSEYFLENVHITTSGYFTDAPFTCALMVFGPDRIIFSVDYPYASNHEAVAFLKAAPVSDADREKIAHGNVEALLKL